MSPTKRMLISTTFLSSGLGWELPIRAGQFATILAGPLVKHSL